MRKIDMAIILSTSDTFSKRLNDLMTTENISRKKLCSKINVQRKSLYKWLNGINYPHYDALIRIADYFKGVECLTFSFIFNII